MNQNQVRKFTLSDALVLVAAAAVSLALSVQPAGHYVAHVLRVVRHYDRAISAAPSGQTGASYKDYLRAERDRELFRVTMKLNYVANVPFPYLVCLSPALLWLRLRKPRPDWRALMRQPGTVACLGGVLTLVLVMSLFVLVGSLVVLSFAIVPVAWSVLAASHRWRSEPSWVDRSGRMVGVGWTASALYAFLYVFFGPFGGL